VRHTAGPSGGRPIPLRSSRSRRLGIVQHTARAPSRRVWPGRIAFASPPTSAAIATTGFGRARHTSRFQGLRTIWGIIPRPPRDRDAPLPSPQPALSHGAFHRMNCTCPSAAGGATPHHPAARREHPLRRSCWTACPVRSMETPARHPTRVRWQTPCERPLKGVRCKGTPERRARTTDANSGEERR
jgi:hypothetical protein